MISKKKGFIAGLVFSLCMAANSALAIPVIEVDNVSGTTDGSTAMVSFDVITGNDIARSFSVFIYDELGGWGNPPSGAWRALNSGTGFEYHNSNGHYEITGSYIGMGSQYDGLSELSQSEFKPSQGFFISLDVYGTGPYYKILNDGALGVVSEHGGVYGAEDDSISPLANPGSWAFNTTPVPEPATILLLGSGLVGLVYRKKKDSACN